MSFKSILVPLFGYATDRNTLSAASALANEFGAHVDAVHSQRDPVDELSMAGAALDPSTVELIFSDAEAGIAGHAKAARKNFEEWSRRSGMRSAAEPDGQPGPSASWLQVVEPGPELMTEAGRLADLIVLPAPDGSKERAVYLPTVEAALTASGRPVLLVPSEVGSTVGNVIAIAWNGSAEGARAVAASMPLLARAKRVVLLSASRKEGGGRAVAQLARSLAWRGIRADTHRFAAKGEIAAALFTAAAEFKADLLVIGAYGHSRLREMVFGGVTSYVLGGVDIPVLMTH